MNIYTVRDNLKNTIAGKEAMLKEYSESLDITVDPLDAGERMAVIATIEFLKINIDELKRILEDVEACCEQATRDSWALNPDRSGGAYTQDEIEYANGWK